jgi:hypothetical protein
MSNFKTVCFYFGSWTPKKLSKMASHLFYGVKQNFHFPILSRNLYGRYLLSTLLSFIINTKLLPVLANIAPAKLRRDAATVQELVNCRTFSSMTMFPISENWLENWSASLSVNGDLIVDPNSRPPGFELRRHDWV